MPDLETIANLCRAAIESDGPLIVALLTAGLVGGATHCAGMCGPFVLAQTTSPETMSDTRPLTEFARLRRAALVPYHAGRATTYTVLGAVLGSGVGGIRNISGFEGLAAALLAFAAALFLVAGVTRLIGSRRGESVKPAGLATRSQPRFPGRWISAIARPLLTEPAAWQRFLLGIVLGFLPCGLLYAALAAAGSAGTALGGGIAMFAFTIGTVPALVGVGYIGQFFRRWYSAAAAFSTVLMFANAGILGVLAWNAAA